jgi:WD40 repeat protein
VRVSEKKVIDMRFSFDGSALFCLDEDGVVTRTNPTDARAVFSFSATVPPVGRFAGSSSTSFRGLDLAANGRLMVISTSEGHHAFWDPQLGKLVQRFDRAVTVHGDEVDLASRAADAPGFGLFTRVGFEQPYGIQSFHALPYSSPAISPRGDAVLLRGHDDRVRVWRLGAPAPVTLCDDRDGFFRDLLAPPPPNAGGLFAKFLNSTTGKLIGNHGACFATADFSLALTTSRDGRAHFWDLHTMQRTWSFATSASAIACDASGQHRSER